MSDEVVTSELVPLTKPMTRTVGFERLFNLGNYSNVTFRAVLNDIPEKYALDSNVVNLVYYLQMLETERAFRKYQELYVKVKTYSVEQYAEAMSFLEQEKETAMNELKELFKQGE